jgi:hypothetical protein
MISIQINKTGEENLFNVPINYFEIIGIDNAKLAEEVLSNQKRLSDNKNIPLYEDTVFSSDNGVQSNALLSVIEALVKQSGLEVKEVWSQVHHPLESTSLHAHGKHDMAFVYYVSAPKGAGDLVFMIEDRMAKELTPVEGRLCVFPAWVKHKVSKNTSDKIRISIAGNLSC